MYWKFWKITHGNMPLLNLVWWINSLSIIKKKKEKKNNKKMEFVGSLKEKLKKSWKINKIDSKSVSDS